MLNLIFTLKNRETSAAIHDVEIYYKGNLKGKTDTHGILIVKTQNWFPEIRTYEFKKLNFESRKLKFFTGTKNTIHLRYIENSGVDIPVDEPDEPPGGPTETPNYINWVIIAIAIIVLLIIAYVLLKNKKKKKVL